jgi:hypothetical protein
MATTDSDIMNTLVRMVVPMRREFGYSLDVGLFTNDPAYAEQTLQLARSSQDPRLQDYAKFIDKRLRGESTGATTAEATSQQKPKLEREKEKDKSSSSAAKPAAPAPALNPEEEALRAKMMKKYTSGLR